MQVLERVAIPGLGKMVMHQETGKGYMALTRGYRGLVFKSLVFWVFDLFFELEHYNKNSLSQLGF